MNRREFLKSAFATTAITATPFVLASTISEREKCKNDTVYFVNKYLLDKNNKLTFWQEEYLYHIATEKNFTVLNGYRQCGKTSMSIYYHIWRKVFFDENVVIITPSVNINNYVIKMIEKRINNLPLELFDTTNIDFSYLKNNIVAEHEFNNHKLRGNNFDSIIFDEFAMYQEQSKCAQELSYFLVDSNMDITQTIFTSTSNKENDGFELICDAAKKAHNGNYFKVSECEAMKV